MTSSPATENGSRVLIIEDELPMRTVLTDCLHRHHYRVLAAADGEEGLNKAISEKPDLIIMDVMMPKLDGFALCRELRRLTASVPILMLTAKGRVEDRVTGLDAGADDFLVKPFSRDELLARVRALLRRMERKSHDLKEITIGSAKIDFHSQRAWHKNKLVHLTTREFAMLRLLFLNPGEVVSRERFLDVVWGYTAFPTTRTVDKHIASLRAKLEENPDAPVWLQTIHAAGYRVIPEAIKNQS